MKAYCFFFLIFSVVIHYERKIILQVRFFLSGICQFGVNMFMFSPDPKYSSGRREWNFDNPFEKNWPKVRKFFVQHSKYINIFRSFLLPKCSSWQLECSLDNLAWNFSFKVWKLFRSKCGKIHKIVKFFKKRFPKMFLTISSFDSFQHPNWFSSITIGLSPFTKVSISSFLLVEDYDNKIVIFLLLKYCTWKLSRSDHNIDTSRHSNSCFFITTGFTPATNASINNFQMEEELSKTHQFLRSAEKAKRSLYNYTGNFRPHFLGSYLTQNFFVQRSIFLHLSDGFF